MTTNSILNLIGNTPVVELQHFSTNPGVRILAKLEGNNPGGSLKDRPVLAMFRDAEERGVLKPGAQLLEATSGNTGIAMAMIAVLRGYRFRAVMAESASIERRKIMKMFGTDIVLTDAAGGTNLAIKTAQQMLAGFRAGLVPQAARIWPSRLHSRCLRRIRHGSTSTSSRTAPTRVHMRRQPALRYYGTFLT